MDACPPSPQAQNGETRSTLPQDGEYIASGGDDQVVLVWRRLTFAQQLALTTTTIENSSARYGGAISLYQPQGASELVEATLLVEDSTLASNVATISGGALALTGDSSLVPKMSDVSSTTLASTTFRECTGAARP